MIEDGVANRRIEGVEVSIVSCPEFLRVGTAIDDFLFPDRVVIGSDDEAAIERVAALYAPILEQHVPVAIDVLADIVRNSTFNDLEKERNVILEEIASARDVPDDYVHDLHSEHAWPEHALGRPIAGYEDTVSDTQDLVGEIRSHPLLRRYSKQARPTPQISTSGVRGGSIR